MNRIKAEDIVNAYLTTGLKPVTGVWAQYKNFNGQDEACGCGLTALVVSKGATIGEVIQAEEGTEHDEQISEFLSRKLDIQGNYVFGFTNGFDGIAWEDTYGSHETEEIQAIFRQGWEDGRSARAEVEKHLAVYDINDIV